MPSIKEIQLITTDNFHILVPDFINEKKILITSYEDMMDLIIQMIQGKYIFVIEKDLLRSLMEDLTFMYCPGDEINKERVMLQLIPSDDEDDEDDEDDGEEVDSIPDIKINNLVNSSDAEDQ